LNEISRLNDGRHPPARSWRADEPTKHVKQEIIRQAVQTDRQDRRTHSNSSNNNNNKQQQQQQPKLGSRVAARAAAIPAEWTTAGSPRERRGGCRAKEYCRQRWMGAFLPPANVRTSLQQISRDLPTHYRKRSKRIRAKLATQQNQRFWPI